MYGAWGYTEILPAGKQLAISSKLDDSATTVNRGHLDKNDHSDYKREG